MLKQLLKITLLGSIAYTTVVHAQEHTVSLGYAQSSVTDYKDLKGVNAQYRFETESPWGIVASASYMTADQTYFYDFDEKEESEVKYLSLLAGPSYRVNEYLSLYALLGLARVEASFDFYDSTFKYSESGKLDKTALAYGAGVALKPIENVTLHLGYEGTKFDGFDDESAKFNGFNIGVGYRF